METRLYRKAILANSAVITTIIGMVVFPSCAVWKENRTEQNTYTILNLVLSKIKEKEKKDSIFITTGKMDIEYYMPQIVSIVKKTPIHQKRYNIKQTATDSILLAEIATISTPQEMAYIKKQTEESFEIALQKISSNERFFKYKRPIKRLNEKGEVMFSREMVVDFSRAVYSVSRPAFTSDNRYALVGISRKDQGGECQFIESKIKNGFSLDT